jgi:hypothetical protein
MWSANSGKSQHGGGGRTGDFALTKAQVDRLNGGGGRGDHGEALGELGNTFLWWHMSKVMVELHSLVVEAAAHGGDEG